MNSIVFSSIMFTWASVNSYTTDSVLIFLPSCQVLVVSSVKIHVLPPSRLSHDEARLGVTAPFSSTVVRPSEIRVNISSGRLSVEYLPLIPIFSTLFAIMDGRMRFKIKKNTAPTNILKKIIALKRLKKAWISLVMYLGEYTDFYINKFVIERIKNMAVTTKVSLKINLSAPRLVNEAVEPLPNPVPLT